LAITTKNNLFIPELYEEAVRGAFAGMTALWNTRAAIVRTGLPQGHRLGDKIKVPYFGTIGELEDVVNDGDALTPALVTSAAEESAVRHAGKAIEMTKWARDAAAGDPYEEGGRQMRTATQRRCDRGLIEVALEAGLPSEMVRDVYNANAPRSLDYDLVVDGKMSWGDEQDNIALMVIHSKVLGDLLKLKDATGRPLLTDPNELGLRRFCGINLGVSDRLPVDRTNANAPRYTSVILKEGALVFWLNENPEVLTDKDVLRNTDVAAVHIYWVVHRYRRLPDMTRPGVVILRHN
jgi:hypothetical protein